MLAGSVFEENLREGKLLANCCPMNIFLLFLSVALCVELSAI